MEELNNRLMDLLKRRGITLATAESLTGGMIASELCAVSGASEVFLEGVVSYTNQSKIRRLGVKQTTLVEYTAVSAAVAEEMAIGVRQCLDTDIGLSSTGVAGPDAFDSDGNPRGLYYIGISYGEKTCIREFRVEGERNEIRKKATESALAFLLEMLEA